VFVSGYVVAFWDNELTGPSGTIVARLYHSHTGIFRDENDYAEGLIAESNSSVEADEISLTWSDVDFTFNNVELSAGVYFLVLYSTELNNNDNGYVGVAGTDSSIAMVGYETFWWVDQGRWGSYAEWD
jgi:hypothetical protein